MTFLLGIIDRDQDRQRMLAHRYHDTRDGCQRLSHGQAHYGDLQLFWEAPESTPVSSSVPSDPTTAMSDWGTAAFVFGGANGRVPGLREPDTRALALTRQVDTESAFSDITPEDGFEVRVAWKKNRELRVGIDVFGFFPLYYWAHQDIVLFGTSPEYFALHPRYSRRISKKGLAAILLFSHCVGQQSIHSGVLRVSPASNLSWTRDAGFREVRGKPLYCSDRRFDRPLDELTEEANSILDSYFLSISGTPAIDLFLSGGQDSRLLAGYLERHADPGQVEAVGVGSPRDGDLGYAQRVSTVLGFPHRSSDLDFDEFLPAALRQIRLESLYGPLLNPAYTTGQSLLQQRVAPFVSGYLGDAVMGDRHLLESFDPSRANFSPQTLMSFMRRYGLTERELNALLPGGWQDFRDLFEQEVSAAWETTEGHHFQRAWLATYQNRTRAHIGSIIWRLSLANFPLLPYYHRPLLEFFASISRERLSDRLLQARLIREQFPRLARIPMATNGPNPRYLHQSLSRRIKAAFIARSGLERVPGMRRLLRGTQPHQRYYMRAYDVNSPGWRAIREAAQAQIRSAGSSLFALEALGEILPEAGFHVDRHDPIVTTAGLKSLTGLILLEGLSMNAEADTPAAPMGAGRSRS